MHAERDYLVKRVFPEIHEWCERRWLLLHEVDLRWGVTREDIAREGVVSACLDGINASDIVIWLRGQRRGVVPNPQQIRLAQSRHPQARFPKDASLTELEIDYAMRRGCPILCYNRNPSYLSDLSSGSPRTKAVYTGQALSDTAVPGSVVLPEGSKQTVYHARWNLQGRTPEIAGLAAALRVEEEVLTQGRLTDFTAGKIVLAKAVAGDLEAAIEARFPGRGVDSGQSVLEAELQAQERALTLNTQGVDLSSTDCVTDLDHYVQGDSRQLLVLHGEAGLGKTTLLATWLHACRARPGGDLPAKLHFRFIGASSGSTTVPKILNSMLTEMQQTGEVPRTVVETIPGPSGREKRQIPLIVPQDPVQLRTLWLDLLPTLGGNGRTVIILDGVDHLEEGLDDVSWLPRNGLPEDVKIVISIGTGTPVADPVVERCRNNPDVRLREVPPMSRLEDRRDLVRRYLRQYFKQLDAWQVEELVSAAGASNPLFLRVVLAELRVLPGPTQLAAQVRAGYGATAVTAFESLMRRMERDAPVTPMEPSRYVPLFFGTLAHARRGLTAEEMQELVSEQLDPAPAPLRTQAAVEDTVAVLLRQVGPYLSRSADRYMLRLTSLIEAARRLYGGSGSGVDKDHHRSSEDWHLLLARTFAHRPHDDVHALSEVPFHYCSAGAWREAARVLTDPAFVITKCEANLCDDLVADYLRALATMPSSHADTDANSYLGGSGGAGEGREPAPAPGGEAATGGVIDPICAPPTVRELLTAFSRHATALSSSSAYGSVPGFFAGQTHDFVTGLPYRFHLAEPDHPYLAPVRQPSSTRSLFPALLAVLQGHRAAVRDVAITADGTRGVSVSDDQTLRVWDLATGRCRYRLPALAHRCVAIAPDGTWAVTGGRGMQVWNLEDGRLARSFPGPPAEITCLSASVDGETLATGCGSVWSGKDDQAAGLWLWDLRSGQLRQRFEECGPLLSIALTPDAVAGVTGSYDGRVIRWDFATGGHHLVEAMPRNATAVAVTPNGAVIVAGDYGGALGVWDFARGRAKALDGHEKVVTGIGVTDDGLRAVTGSEDGSVLVWDLYTGRCLRRLRGTASEVTAVALTPDGARALSGAGAIWAAHEDESVRLWDPLNGRPDEDLFGVPTEPVVSVHLANDGATVLAVTGEYTRTVTLWDAGPRRQRPWHSAPELAGATLTADGHHLLEWRTTDRHKPTVVLRDLRTGREVHRMRVRREDVLLKAAPTPDGGRFVAGGQSIQVGCPQTRQWIWGYKGAIVRSLAVRPDGGAVAAGTLGGGVEVFDMPSGRRIPPHGRKHEHSVDDLAFSPDGQLCASASWDGMVRVWTVPAMECLREFTTNVPAQCVRFTPDGRYLLAGDWNGLLRVWNLVTGESVSILPLGGGVNCVSEISPGPLGESGLVAVGMGDGAISLVSLMHIGYPDRLTGVRLWRFSRTRIAIRCGRAGGWDKAVTVVCSECRRRVPVPDSVLGVVADLGQRYTAAKGIPSLDLPAEAWENSGLISRCPSCQQTIHLNPFILDGQRST